MKDWKKHEGKLVQLKAKELEGSPMVWAKLIGFDGTHYLVELPKDVERSKMRTFTLARVKDMDRDDWLLERLGEDRNKALLNKDHFLDKKQDDRVLAWAAEDPDNAYYKIVFPEIPHILWRGSPTAEDTIVEKHLNQEGTINTFYANGFICRTPRGNHPVFEDVCRCEKGEKSIDRMRNFIKSLEKEETIRRSYFLGKGKPWNELTYTKFDYDDSQPLPNPSHTKTPMYEQLKEGVANIREVVKNKFLSDDEKLLRKYHLKDENGNWTHEAQVAINALLTEDMKERLIEICKEQDALASAKKK